MKNMFKRGQQAATVGAVSTFLLLLVLGILLTVTSEVNETIQSGFVTGASGCNATAKTACGFNFNSSQNILLGQDEFAGQVPTVFLLAAVGLILAVLIAAFAFVRLR